MAAPPRSVHGDHRGFTLIEILVVVFVIAVMVGVTLFQLGGRDRDGELRIEAQRLRLTLELARDEALLGAEEWALAVEEDGYRFLRLDDGRGRWRAAEERPFEPHRLPAGIALRLELDEGRALPELARREGSERRDQGPRPSLLVLSSGEITPFVMELVPEGEGRTWRVSSDGLATVTAEPAS